MIPPNADLLFGVELLDINHKKSVAALAKYRQTLDLLLLLLLMLKVRVLKRKINHSSPGR